MKLKILQRFITLVTFTFILFVSYNLVSAADQNNIGNAAPEDGATVIDAAPSSALDELE